MMHRHIPPEASSKPPHRDERRKARDRKRWPEKTNHATFLHARVRSVENGFVEFVYVCMGVSARKPCYDFCRSKGPVLDTPWDTRLQPPPESGVLSRPNSSGTGLPVSSWLWGWERLSVRTAARRIPCVYPHPRPLGLDSQRRVSESRYGAQTMTKVYTLARAAAPITTASRRAAPIQSASDITDPHVIALHAAAENALASALHLLRSLDCDPAKLQQATGRAMRATTLLKRACAAQVEGGAA